MMGGMRDFFASTLISPEKLAGLYGMVSMTIVPFGLGISSNIILPPFFFLVIVLLSKDKLCIGSPVLFIY